MGDSTAQYDAFQAWMVYITGIASQRDAILTERTDLKKQRSLLSQQEQHFFDTMKTVLSLVDIAIKDRSPTEYDKLHTVTHELKASWDAIQRLRQETSSLEDSLSSKEYFLTSNERDAYYGVDLRRQQGQLQPTSLPEPSSITNEPSQHPGSSAKNIRDALYSRMGDLRILMDRIHDFEDYLRQELDERDILRAAGHIPPSDDKTFFQESRIERGKIQTELEEAQADVERLKQLCRQQGVHFEDVQFSEPSQQERLYVDSYSADSCQEQASGLPLLESTSGILDTFFATHERVASWLNPPASAVLPIAGADGEDGAYARRESRSDAGWVFPQRRRSWPVQRCPDPKASTAGHEAQHGMPVQTMGPPPGSESMAALLKESMSEPAKAIRNSKRTGSYTTV